MADFFVCESSLKNLYEPGAPRTFLSDRGLQEADEGDGGTNEIKRGEWLGT